MPNDCGSFQSWMFELEHGAAGGQPGFAAEGSQSCTSFEPHCASHDEIVTLLETCTQQMLPAQSAVDVHPSDATGTPFC